MRVPLLTWLLVVVLFAPGAAARTCITKSDDLCDVARQAELDRIFGEYADVGLIVLGLIGVALVLSILTGFGWPRRRRRAVKVEVEDADRDVEPGGTTRLRLDLVNPNRRVAREVRVEPADLPEGWTARVRAVRELPGGFRSVEEFDGPATLRLEGRDRGGHQAAVHYLVTAPAGAPLDEAQDVQLRIVPFRRGHPREGAAKTAHFHVAVTTRTPLVQIQGVQHNPDHLKPGLPVLTRAKLVNRGEREAVDVAVQFLLNGREVDRKVVPAIKPASEAEVEFSWTAQPGENRIRVAVA